MPTHRFVMRSIHGSENGSVLLEFSVVISLLFLFSLALIDVGRWLDLHIRVSRLSCDAARYASSLPGLEQGEVGPVHDRIRLHISEMISDYGLKDENITFLAKYSEEAESRSAKKMISITIGTRFDPITRIFAHYVPETVAARADTPYLFGS